jgi:hypothetical protein
MHIISSNQQDDHFKLNIRNLKNKPTIILYLHGNTNDRLVNYIFLKNSAI